MRWFLLIMRDLDITGTVKYEQDAKGKRTFIVAFLIFVPTTLTGSYQIYRGIVKIVELVTRSEALVQVIKLKA